MLHGYLLNVCTRITMTRIAKFMGANNAGSGECPVLSSVRNLPGRRQGAQPDFRYGSRKALRADDARRLEKALELRGKDAPISLVSERHWVKFV
jgi:hypothetical protein